MNSLRDILLNSINPDVIVKVCDVEGNEKKKLKLFNDLRNFLAPRYKIFADTEKHEIYIQYKK